MTILYNVYFFVTILFFSIWLSIQDIKFRKVSNLMIVLALIFSMAGHLLFNFKNSWIYIISAICFGIFYIIVFFLSGKKLGIGDVYFGIFQGMCLFVKWLPVVILIEAFFAFVFIMINKASGKKIITFPFVPFMALSLGVTYILSLFIHFPF